MSIFGKTIGLFVGSFLFHGPFGALIGFFIGHLYDIGYFNDFIPNINNPDSAQQFFFDATFAIMGFVAKSDGRVTEKQIQTAERIMRQMQLSGLKRRRAIEQFNIGKQVNFDCDGMLTMLKQRYWLHQDLIRTFLEIQLQIAMSDGVLSSPSRSALQRVFVGLGYSANHFQQFEQQTKAGYNYYRSQRQSPSSSPQSSLKEAYRLLEVSASASDAEVKKAYRKMMSKHHPDRLMSKGVPPEMIRIATQKTQQVKEAYQQIKEARGVTK